MEIYNAIRRIILFLSPCAPPQNQSRFYVDLGNLIENSGARAENFGQQSYCKEITNRIVSSFQNCENSSVYFFLASSIGRWNSRFQSMRSWLNEKYTCKYALSICPPSRCHLSLAQPPVGARRTKARIENYNEPPQRQFYGT